MRIANICACVLLRSAYLVAIMCAAEALASEVDLQGTNNTNSPALSDRAPGNTSVPEKTGPKPLRGKAEIKASIARIIKEGGSSTEVMAEANAYLADRSIPESDRYEVRATTHHIELSRSRITTREERLAQRARLARELIKEFPNDARGYGYFLQIAGSDSGPEGKRMAEEVLRMPSPPSMRSAATRLISQRDLVGKPLSVASLDPSKYSGKTVVIYTWDMKRRTVLNSVKRWATVQGVALVAVNIDADSATAVEQADTLGVLGERLYEPKGLDGPLATALCFTSPTSVYLVNSNGVLIDVSGHENTFNKLKDLTGSKGEEAK
jgi:hypothetical protein